MSDASQKPCRHCREQIPSAATRCPKCQSWQSARAYLSGNPQAWLGLLTLPFLLLLLLPLWRVFDGGADFSRYTDQVEILEAEFHVPDQERSSRDLVTIGRLRNNSPVRWKDVVFEVQFFDKHGKLVGAKSDEDMDLVLVPGEEHAFQVTMRAELPVERYASQKVFVRHAREARNWP